MNKEKMNNSITSSDEANGYNKQSSLDENNDKPS